MTVLVNVLAGIYLFCVVGLTVFSLGILTLLILWWHHRNDEIPTPALIGDWPKVTVQLPVYNERSVVARLINAVAKLDYPRNRLHIQILDDSDDDTDVVVAQLVAHHSRTGLSIAHIQRPDRTWYKAGALAYGLKYTDDELIAVFDADFVPDPSFLRRTIPHFVADPGLGIVQARWAHLNAQQNLITRTQAMSIDRHFVIEQTARNRGNLLLSFNGSGGIWRRACIEEAGGWSGGTVTEDLDLSYRAQMCGWRYLYLPDVAVRAELPPQLTAFKRQQARWAKGTTQNLMRLLFKLWRSPCLSPTQKYMGTLHLSQYLPQPMLLTMTLLTPPMMMAGVLNRLPLTPLGLISLLAPVMYVLSQRHLYHDWMHRLVAFPVLLGVGSGIMLNNTIAVLGAFLQRPSVFKRTPKFSDKSWQTSQYALRVDWTIVIEIILIAYTAAGGIIALHTMPRLAPFLFGQACGFGTVVAWELFEEFKISFNWMFARKRAESPSSTLPD
jgi:cellulose synthase/poly-beta-1,6-N-acetylglucosamine synthase-like glycosyltransferase